MIKDLTINPRYVIYIVFQSFLNLVKHHKDYPDQDFIGLKHSDVLTPVIQRG